MTNGTASFDLLKEPWIPCLDSHGKAVELSLTDTLCRAHELRAVADPSPLATFALYRFLFAVVHRVVDGPRNLGQWKELWEAGRLDEAKVRGYMERWSERFDLFHPKWPFYQTAGLSVIDQAGRPTPTWVARLLLSSLNTPTLFDHSHPKDGKSLSAAEAARGLILAQAWALGGGKGPNSNHFGSHPYLADGPCVGAIGVVAMGSNLFRTLALNLECVGPDRSVPFLTSDDDRPTWERDQPRPPGRHVPTGYLEYLTWQPRHVRLEAGPGNRVEVMHFAQGAQDDPDAGYTNPFAFYRFSKDNGMQAVRLDPKRAVWRDSAPLFSATHEGDGRPAVLRSCAQRRARGLLKEDMRLFVQCFGLATDKRNHAKPLAWRHEEIPASVRLLDDPDLLAEFEAGLAGVEKTYSALQKALRRLTLAVLKTETHSPDTQDVKDLVSRLESHLGFWERMEAGFRTFAMSISAESRRAWLEEARRVALRGLERVAASVGASPARRWRALAQAKREFQKALPATNAPSTEPE